MTPEALARAIWTGTDTTRPSANFVDLWRALRHDIHFGAPACTLSLFKQRLMGNNNNKKKKT